MTSGPSPDHAFIEFVHGRRAVVGGVLLALAVACLIAAGWCGFRGLAVDDKPADAPADVAAKPAEAVSLDPWPYLVGLSAGLLASLGLGGVGAFFVGKVPELDADRRRRADRILLLVGGYVFGLSLRACGLLLFVHWFDKLSAWADGAAGSHKTGWWPVAALLQFLVGAGVSFLAALPARSEERNQPWVRRAVYAVNFALAGVLMVVALVLVNAVVVKKLPAQLDTTSSGFYSLTPETKKYVEGLKQPVKAYLLSTELNGHQYEKIQDDALRLLNSCQKANPTRFEVKVLSATANPTEIRDLQDKYKAADLGGLGVLLTSGDDPDRFTHVPLQKMGVSKRGSSQDEPKFVFVGESQMVGGMMALTEEKTVVYYTRGSGEMALAQPENPAAAALVRPAFRLQDALTSSQCEARPLDIDPFNPAAKVPDAAAMVLVLDPLTPLPPATTAALERYMTTARPGGQKGKLLVFAGAHNAPGGTTVTKTGLETVLAPLGIEVADRVIYNQPVAERAPPDMVIVGVDADQVEQRQPIAVAARTGLITRGVRPVLLAPGGRGPAATPFMGVAADGYTWLEKGVIDPPNQALADMAKAGRNGDGAYQQERQLSNRVTRTVAALANDAEGKPVAAVFGFADGLTDDAKGDRGTTAGVFKAAVGWLRERPPAPDITPKEYDQYTPKKGVTDRTLVYLPVAATLLAILLLGLGVWAVRRK
jgi:hypothetical protein